ncbi:hypothetical protein PCE1_002619 [Barthelona sp. PCE]
MKVWNCLVLALLCVGFAFVSANKPFTLSGDDMAKISIEKVSRVITVGEWGKTKFRDDVEIKNLASADEGFSRWDYARMQNLQMKAIKSVEFDLPKNLNLDSLYYRDQIGNISTSNYIVKKDYVTMDIKPRYPIMGQWRSTFYYGFKINTNQIIETQDDITTLKVQALPNLAGDKRTVSTKIRMPETAEIVSFEWSLPEEGKVVESELDQLDFKGRPTIVFEHEGKYDNVELTIKYKYSPVTRYRKVIRMFVTVFVLIAGFIAMKKILF